jgi:hypothetical protein
VRREPVRRSPRRLALPRAEHSSVGDTPRSPRGCGAAVRTAVLLLPLEGAAGKECHRKWVVSVPMPLQYWLAASQDLTAKVHTIIRTTITQYYVHQAVTRGNERQKVQPGSSRLSSGSVGLSI